MVNLLTRRVLPYRKFDGLLTTIDMKLLFTLVTIGTLAYASTNDVQILPKIKVYCVMSYRTGDRTIEKIYMKRDNAKKYADMYKDSHNYEIEEFELTE
jgi:hypothetical protein